MDSKPYRLGDREVDSELYRLVDRDREVDSGRLHLGDRDRDLESEHERDLKRTWT